MATKGADIFNAHPTFGGAFAMDEATLTFNIEGCDGIASATDAGLGYLVQGIQASYSRPVERMYELGPNKTTYYIVDVQKVESVFPGWQPLHQLTQHSCSALLTYVMWLTTHWLLTLTRQ